MRTISDLTLQRQAGAPVASSGRSGPAITLRKPPAPPRCSPRTARFRSLIEQAEADGVGRPDMTLRLTQGDADLLKRDPGLLVSDIHFAGGVMRFLGVIVEQGGVRESELDTSGVREPRTPESPVQTPKAKGQKKSTREPGKPKTSAPKASPAGT